MSSGCPQIWWQELVPPQGLSHRPLASRPASNLGLKTRGGARSAWPSPSSGSIMHGGVNAGGDGCVPPICTHLLGSISKAIAPRKPGGAPQSPKGRGDPKAAAPSSPGGHRPGAAVAWGHESLGPAGEAERAAILGVTLKATASPNPRRRPPRQRARQDRAPRVPHPTRFEDGVAALGGCPVLSPSPWLRRGHCGSP